MKENVRANTKAVQTSIIDELRKINGLNIQHATDIISRLDKAGEFVINPMSSMASDIKQTMSGIDTVEKGIRTIENYLNDNAQTLSDISVNTQTHSASREKEEHSKRKAQELEQAISNEKDTSHSQAASQSFSTCDRRDALPLPKIESSQQPESAVYKDKGMKNKFKDASPKPTAVEEETVISVDSQTDKYSSPATVYLASSSAVHKEVTPPHVDVPKEVTPPENVSKDISIQSEILYSETIDVENQSNPLMPDESLSSASTDLGKTLTPKAKPPIQVTFLQESQLELKPPTEKVEGARNDDVETLHSAETTLRAERDEQKDKTLEANILFLLNRLTPKNVKTLAVGMKKLQVKDYDDLQQLVRIFFDKATIETKFVSAYAELVKVMAGLKVPPPFGLKENQATFRVVMLTLCQKWFEADKTVIFEDPEQKRKKIEQEMPADTPDRRKIIDNILNGMKLKRLNFYGNIKFMGELFKVGLLTQNIMHDSIYRLLKAKDDNSLVCLRNLITIVGQNLDTDKAKARMDQYFSQMTKLAEERNPTITFTIKETIELRSNHWVPRKEQDVLKEMNELHTVSNKGTRKKQVHSKEASSSSL